MNNKIVQQKDHIILPKATLYRFSDIKTKKISVLDLSNPDKLIIKEKFPKSFHTKKNYYDPTVDKEIKRYETQIGEWNKKLSDIIKKHANEEINFNKLKSFIIRIITIQFHRCIIADDEKLRAFQEIKTKKYNEISYYQFKNGIPSIEFINFKCDFKKAAENIETFRRYAQRFIMQDNIEIINSYRDFKPCIIYIPDEIDFSFILPPQHFVGIDNVARVILAPRLAIALYPNDFNCKYIQSLSEKEVECLVPRSIESALDMPKEYREIVGEKKTLEVIKEKIYKYRKMMEIVNEQVLLINKSNEFSIDNQNVFEIIVALMYLKPKYKKIVIDLSALSKSLFFEKEGLNMFLKWGYKIVLISNTNFINDSLTIPTFNTMQDAISFLLKQKVEL